MCHTSLQLTTAALTQAAGAVESRLKRWEAVKCLRKAFGCCAGTLEGRIAHVGQGGAGRIVDQVTMALREHISL